MFKRMRRAASVVGLFILVSGCRDIANPEPVAEPVPERIVSVVPAVTEMLFAMGAGDRVVGVSDFDTFPDAVQALPRVGALLDPNLERIFELQPDLVVTYGSQSTLAERLEGVGIRSFPFVSGSVGEMLAAIESLGEAIGEPAAGRDLASGIANSLEDIRAQMPPERPRVLLAHSRDPGVMGTFYSEGGPSYLNEILEIAGGENLFADVAIKSFQPSLEEVLERAPEVIIELLPASANTPEGIRQRLEDWRQLGSVPAVRNGRVYILADDYLLVIGPRLDQVAAALAEAIHPSTGERSP